MRTRRLGKSELEVPVILFGAWAIGGWNWGGSDDEAAVRALQTAIDCGMNAIDTAPVYGFGHSERVVGRALKGRRERAIVMTKIGLRWDDTRGEFYFETVDAHGKTQRIHYNSRPWSVVHEVEQSLKRLSIEQIDLIQIHRPDPKTPIAETMSALAQLREQGKVRAIGTSNFTCEQLTEARAGLGDVPLASEQAKYSLVARDLERAVLPWTREHVVAVLAYSPLEQGLLTGKVGAERTFPTTDGRHKRPSFTPENRARVNAVLARVVQPIASAHKATIGQIVLAWTVAQPGVTCAIVGARTSEQVLENAKAGDIELAHAELASIRAAFEALELDLPGKSGPIKGAIKRMLGR